jgi:hypothetical protein
VKKPILVLWCYYIIIIIHNNNIIIIDSNTPKPIESLMLYVTADSLKIIYAVEIWCYIVTCISDFRRGFGFANRFIWHSLLVTTINYKYYNTLRITVIITYKYNFLYQL